MQISSRLLYNYFDGRLHIRIVNIGHLIAVGVVLLQFSLYEDILFYRIQDYEIYGELWGTWIRRTGLGKADYVLWHCIWVSVFIVLK